MYELIIIGGGPAGVSAGVYAARKKLNTLFLTDTFGGQSVASEKIENWIGEVAISGQKLAERLEEHLKTYKDIIDIEDDLVMKISEIEGGFEVKTEKNHTYQTQTVLIATGSSRKKLDVPGAAEFENRGVVYCASCDGPLFAGKDVAVVGGGNAGFETAAQLLNYAKSVTLLHRSDRFKADAVTVDKVLEHENMKAEMNVHVKEIKGETLVNGLVYEKDGSDVEIPVEGIFIEIGLTPNTDFIDFVDKDKYGRIIVNPKTKRSSCRCIWAAGDCTDELYHQNNIAAGDAVSALENIYLAIKANK